MSYEEILETRGRFRVKLVADEYPDEPYDDGQSPLMRLEYRGGWWRADHVMTGNHRDTSADFYVEAAVERWGTDFGLLEKYLRAYHGATQVKTWHSGDFWYVTYDTAAWREQVGAPEFSVDMSEWIAYCQGDVWGWEVEKLVTWHTADPAYPDREDWEHVDSCWGYYGSDGENGKYLRDCATEALEYTAGPYEHLEHAHEFSPAILVRWDYDTLVRAHADNHKVTEPGHVHPDPHEPFTVAEPAQTSGPSGK